jgi:hypothetical protein
VSIIVGVVANSLDEPQAAGNRWVFLNWALGLQELGCRVIWLEGVKRDTSMPALQANVSALKNDLSRYGLANSVALFSRPLPGQCAEPIEERLNEHCLTLDAIDGVDLLLNIAYDIPPEVLCRVRRTAFVDIDPGLTQMWMSEGQLNIPQHDTYFTIGETVGEPETLFPDCGLRWHYTPPPVFLPAWSVAPSNLAAPYTTVTNWWDGWVVFRQESYANRKRDGFLPFLGLPSRTSRRLELAVPLGTGDINERLMLEQHGWHVRDATVVASTPWDYQDYIRESYGEFSCAKPSCTRTQNAWISDRTLCYLASGKPAVVQHTGRSRFLPDRSGLFRFGNLEEAIAHLEAACADYEHQSKLARALAEEYFDARKIVTRVLERALR